MGERQAGLARRSRRHLGRGADGGERVRGLVYKLRLSEEERHQLRLRAAANGVTMSRLLIDSALSARVSPAEREALFAQFNRVAGQLGKIGSNVNQLAFWANAHREEASGTAAIAAQVEAVAEELRGWADAIVSTVR